MEEQNTPVTVEQLDSQNSNLVLYGVIGLVVVILILIFSLPFITSFFSTDSQSQENGSEPEISYERALGYNPNELEPAVAELSAEFSVANVDFSTPFSNPCNNFDFIYGVDGDRSAVIVQTNANLTEEQISSYKSLQQHIFGPTNLIEVNEGKPLLSLTDCRFTNEFSYIGEADAPIDTLEANKNTILVDLGTDLNSLESMRLHLVSYGVRGYSLIEFREIVSGYDIFTPEEIADCYVQKGRSPLQIYNAECIAEQFDTLSNANEKSAAKFKQLSEFFSVNPL